MLRPAFTSRFQLLSWHLTTTTPSSSSSFGCGFMYRRNSMHTDSSLRAVRDNFETCRGWHDAVESAAYAFCANRHTAGLRWIADAWHPHSHDTNSSGICASLAHTAAVYAPRCMRLVGCSSRRKHNEHNLVVRN